jgi:hypothetical protein
MRVGPAGRDPLLACLHARDAGSAAPANSQQRFASPRPDRASTAALIVEPTLGDTWRAMSQRVEVVQKAHDAFNRGGLDGFLELFDADLRL